MYLSNMNNRNSNLIILICIIIICKDKLCKEKSCKEKSCEKGVKLILSAISEENRLARHLQCESKKIQRDTENLRKNPCKKVDTEELLRVNCCVKERLKCIEAIENKILDKINKGVELILSGDSSCCISQLDKQWDNEICN